MYCKPFSAIYIFPQFAPFLLGPFRSLKEVSYCIEIQKMWNIKSFVTLVVTGATEILPKGLKRFGSSVRKACNRFSTSSSSTRNITHNKGNATICNLKRECRGSPLAQDKAYLSGGYGMIREEITMTILYRLLGNEISFNLASKIWHRFSNLENRDTV
jgi:hypothetical protein